MSTPDDKTLPDLADSPHPSPPFTGLAHIKSPLSRRLLSLLLFPGLLGPSWLVLAKSFLFPAPAPHASRRLPRASNRSPFPPPGRTPRWQL